MSDCVTAFSLLETMRWEGCIELLDLHLERLATSADELGFAFDHITVVATLEEHVGQFESDEPHRMRLLHNPDGSQTITASVIPEISPFGVVVLDEETIELDPKRKHKTSNRSDYERRYQRALNAGFDEAILVNKSGNVVEGTRTNIWVLLDGLWTTPPLSEGALNGVFRTHLLRSTIQTVVSPISIEDFRSADRVAITNAVHGFIEVRLGGGESSSID